MSTLTVRGTSPREELLTAGYTVVRDALDPSMLAALGTYADGALAAEERDHFDRFRCHGSMLPLDWRHPLTTELVGWPATSEALVQLGFAEPRWLSGYVISKPPRSPALWWHQDWWAWDEPDSFATTPPQMFVMYYLRDVGPEDGCLRVIPGSHRRRHRLHDELPEAHSERLRDDDVAERAQRSQPDEVAVPVSAGDAVVGDVRLLHSTYANASCRRRTCFTLWYLPSYDDISDRLKAYVINHPFLPPAGWWRSDSEIEVPRRLAPLLPTYDGPAKPAEYRRTPPRRF